MPGLTPKNASSSYGWRALSRATAVGLRAGFAMALCSAWSEAASAVAPASTVVRASRALRTLKIFMEVLGFVLWRGRRIVAGKGHGSRAGHGTDGCAVADVQVHLALKLQFTLHRGARADDDGRVAAVEKTHAVGLLH